MTTPTPTHASAVLGMVEFARNVSQDNDADCNGWASAARAALAAWEQRPRLRDDPAVVTALYEGMNDRGFDQTYKEARGLLDAIEAALFGTGPHPGGEPAKEKSE